MLTPSLLVCGTTYVLLKSVADNIEGNTICALGDAAAWPVQSFVKKFRDEFQAHVDAGKCTVLSHA